MTAPHSPDNPLNVVSLREYVDRVFEEKDKAVEIAYRDMDMRIDKLNELRAEVQTDRSQFLRFDVYDEKHTALVNSVTYLERTMHDTIEDKHRENSLRIDDLERWRFRMVGVFLVLVPLAGVIGAAIHEVFTTGN